MALKFYNGSLVVHEGKTYHVFGLSDDNTYNIRPVTGNTFLIDPDDPRYSTRLPFDHPDARTHGVGERGKFHYEMAPTNDEPLWNVPEAELEPFQPHDEYGVVRDPADGHSRSSRDDAAALSESAHITKK